MPSIVWRGHLTFGLVSIPVKLFRAARRERVQLHYVHRSEQTEPEPFTPGSRRDPEPDRIEPQRAPIERPLPNRDLPAPLPVSRVRQSLITQDHEHPVGRQNVLRGYEVEPDQYVVFERDELKRLQLRTSATMEIVRSVRLAEVDPVFFETSYYVVPDRGGEKSYALLFEALTETQRIALARVGMYGREHVVIVRPGEHGMLAHTMFYTDEVRFENEFRADVNGLGAKELELARTFLEAIEAPFAPEEFKDVYREELESLIAKKMSQTGAAPAASTPLTNQPVVDILEALRQSIAMTRKPPAKETQLLQKAVGGVTEIKRGKPSRKSR
ncbi:MAG TPA: Ku protein [Bryobacteraceae bacterium]|nr:Ku protein [Bryobacteraceae bacterium]